MLFRFLADLIVIFHLLFIVFALLGGLLCLWRKWCVLLHLPAAVWAAVIEFQGGYCPLTPLENQLRNLSDTAGYEGGFIEHYLIPVIYPPGLTHEMQNVLGAMAIGINVCVYLYVLRQRWRKG